MVFRFWQSALLIGCLAFSASADIIILNDGTVLSGTIKKSDDGWVVTDLSGVKTTVRRDQLKSIQMTPASGAGTSVDRLASLRKSVEAVSDLPTIIDRYQKFIDTAPDAASRKAAQDDLAGWKQKQQEGRVKLGNQWVAPTDLARVQGEALQLAGKAREYLKQGRLKEADPILQQAIATDPNCASAYYLRGVMLFRQDQFIPARKAFETTLALVPDHLATLNNLAVVLAHQNLIPASMNQYDRAMAVAPQDRFILTNVAEALAGLTETQRNNDVLRRVQKHFEEQIPLLEQKLASQNMYRWGATWVSGDDLKKLKAAEAEIKTKLDALAVDFDAAQARIVQIDQSVADNNSTLRRLEAESVRYDVSGNLIRTAYPPVYYEIQRDNQRLGAERAANAAKMEQMRTAAKGIQAQLPTPQYTGVQQLMGIEATPVAMVDDSPATPRPATVQPATIEPARVEPATVQPATVERATVQPAKVQPAIVEPARELPAIVQSATTQPAIVQPAIGQPATTQPAILQPAIVQSPTTQPAIVQPAIEQRAILQPATTQPAQVQPAVVQPATTQPITIPPAGPVNRSPSR